MPNVIMTTNVMIAYLKHVIRLTIIIIGTPSDYSTA